MMRWIKWTLGLWVLLSVAAVLPPAASAAVGGVPSWSAPSLVDLAGLPDGTIGARGLSCPSVRLCVAVDRNGDILTTSSPAAIARWHSVKVTTLPLHGVSCPSANLCLATGLQALFVSTHPTGSAADWRLVLLPGSGLIDGISCAGERLCVVVSRNGRAFSSTNPAGGPGAWHRERMARSSSDQYRTAVSCPTVHLCVAIDSWAGAVFTTTDPRRLAARWHRHWLTDRGLAAISCPSVHLCVAIGSVGDVYTSTSPTTGRWHVARRAAPVGGPGVTSANITCLSRALCVVVGPGGVYATTDPTGGPGAWRKTQGPSDGRLSGVACPSELLCLITATSGFVLMSRDPAIGPWHSYGINGGPRLTGVSCPTESLCVAVDERGDVLTATDPAGGESAWQTTLVAPRSALRGVSCPTVSLCVAVGSDGVFVSTDPTGGPTAWSQAYARSPGDFFGIDCPSSNLCLASGISGSLVTSTDPLGGAGAWSDAVVDPIYPGADYGPNLMFVACSSGTLCIVGDDNRSILSSTTPTAGAISWQKSVSAGYPASLSAGSCPSSQLCVVLDGFGKIYTSTNPSASPPSWQPQIGRGEPGPLDCTSTAMCVAFAGAPGQFLASTDPTGGQSAWRPDGTDPSGRATAISCVPDTTICVAVDSAGNVLTSS
jgi:hypothetical protein